MNKVQSLKIESTRARYISGLNGFMFYGTYRLINELKTLTDDETAFKIVSILREKMEKIKERYGDLAQPGFRFFIPEKSFDYYRVGIQLVYQKETVLDTLFLAFIDDPDSYKDLKAVPEDQVSVWEGESWISLKAYMVQPRIKNIIKRMDQKKQAILDDALRHYEACFKEPPQERFSFHFKLTPEQIEFKAGNGEWLQCTIEL